VNQTQAPADTALNVAIVGAGIGGLATLLSLRRIGIAAALFERAPNLDAIKVGYGIHLWSNAMRALGTLGVAQEVEAAGERFERMQIMSLRGRRLLDFPVDELARSVGAPTIGINRADLHAVLAGAVGERTIRFGSELVDLQQDGDGVTLRFSDGHDARYDFVVAADGIKSFVRSKVLGDGPPSFVGVVERHAAVAVSDERVPPRTFRERWGHGSRFGFYPIKGGTCWYTLVPEPAGGTDPGGPKQAVLERFGDWPEPTPHARRGDAGGGGRPFRHPRATPRRAVERPARPPARRRRARDAADRRPGLRAGDRGRRRPRRVHRRRARPPDRDRGVRGEADAPRAQVHADRVAGGQDGDLPKPGGRRGEEDRHAARGAARLARSAARDRIRAVSGLAQASFA
jgi:2-polyprenyl-6-methoxyphenol hydroxylase-like FAD-dependent oxidoreductase